MKTVLFWILIIGFSVLLKAQHMKINDPSPDIKQVVTVVPFDSGQHTSFNKFFLSVPATADLQSSTFILTNQTDRDIVGLAVRWILRDSAGNQESVPWFTHSYLSADVAPLIGPRGEMMVAPGSFVPDTSMKSGGFLGTVATDRTVQKFKSALEVSVEIDSVIFADGEVVGPKSLPLVQQIKDRQVAAQMLVRHLEQANLKGVKPQDALQQSVATPSAWGASVDRQRRILARQLGSARDFDSELQAVKRLQKPLNFHRKDGSTL
jgi:hypothetical protein